MIGWRELVLLLMAFILIAVNAVPALIAYFRNIPVEQKLKIAVNNLLWSWTVIGWIILLFMAINSKSISDNEIKKH